MQGSSNCARWLYRIAALVLITGLLAGCGSKAQSSSGLLFSPSPVPLIRTIQDPSSGSVWILVPTPACPGCPGKLIPVASPDHRSSTEISRLTLQAQVIHSWDRLVVEDSAGPVRSRLDAVALQPAREGGVLNARLAVNGRQVRVVALGPGRVRLAPSAEWLP
jgi:hypothetical protein